MRIVLLFALLHFAVPSSWLIPPALAANIRITQGEDAVLNLTATTGAGAAFDLSGATFTSYITGAKGSVNSFSNSKHAIVSAAAGTFTLTLTETDTALISVGINKEILTKVVQGTTTTYLRAQILDVKAALPSP